MSKPASPFKLLLHSKNSPQDARNEEEIELLSELLLHNSIFQYLKLPKNATRQLCNRMSLVWADHPHIIELSNHEAYFILEGKAFEYMHNDSLVARAKLSQNNDYIMVRKIATNDFFIAYSPSTRYADEANYKKYQLMVDEGTLIGKLSSQPFTQMLLPLIEARTRQINFFLKEIEMLNYLPNLLLYELGKYMSEVTFPAGAPIIRKEETNPYVYFIQSGEVELKAFSKAQTRSSPSKNYYASLSKNLRKTTLKENNIFGIDSLAQTVADADNESATCVEARTHCLLYRIEKRILAIVISTFEEGVSQKGKIMSSVNLNEQIQGQGYESKEKAMLIRNVSMIKTSERKIRDIKLRFFNTSQKKRDKGLPLYEEVQTNPDELETLRDIKYQSCHNFNSNRASRDYSKLFQDTARTRSNVFQETTRFDMFPHPNEAEFNRVSQIVISPIEENDLGRSLQPSQPQLMRQTRSSFHLKKKSKLPGGKEEADIIRAYLQKKLKNEMLKKAELILERNQSQKIKQNCQVKRMFSQRNIRSRSHQQPRRDLGEEIYERMNKINEYPLLNHIEGERKKLESQVKRIIESKLNAESRKPGAGGQKTRGNILIQNN